MSFHIGQKVVCIGPCMWVCRRRPNLICGKGPIFGNVYTISDLDMTEARGLYLVLQELQPLDCWHSSSFRPAVERKYDISIFTAMLDPERIRTERERVMNYGSV